MFKTSDLRSAALQACCLAAAPNRDYGSPVEVSDPSALPPELRRAAAALMHSALAHLIGLEVTANPAKLRWAGHDWYLTLKGGGYVHITPAVGGVGLMARSPFLAGDDE